MWSYERLWVTLKENGMTIKDLEKRKILTKTMCNHILQDEPIPMRCIGKLCQFLHCNVDRIIQHVKND